MPPSSTPVESVWSALRRSLANLAKHYIIQLTALVKTGSGGYSTDPALLTGFLTAPDSTSRPFSNPTIEDR